MQRADGALAAADAHLHVGGLQIRGRRPVRRDDGELQREEIRAALGRFLRRGLTGRTADGSQREKEQDGQRLAAEGSLNHAHEDTPAAASGHA